LACMILLSAPLMMRADESCKTCPQEVEVTGQVAHFRKDETVQGVPTNDSAAFQEEIFGHDFSVVVPHLPAGKYTVIIGEAEIYWHQPGERVFDIAVGNKVVATNYDIISKAGGDKKVVYITAEVEHRDDSLGGPLMVKFTAVKENAKFNTFE